MAEHTVTVESTLLSLLEGKKYSTIRDILATMNGADIAAVLGEIAPEHIPLMPAALKDMKSSRLTTMLVTPCRGCGSL